MALGRVAPTTGFGRRETDMALTFVHGHAIARALRLDRLRQLVRARQQERRRVANDGWDFYPLYDQRESFQPVHG